MLHEALSGRKVTLGADRRLTKATAKELSEFYKEQSRPEEVEAVLQFDAIEFHVHHRAEIESHDCRKPCRCLGYSPVVFLLHTKRPPYSKKSEDRRSPTTPQTAQTTSSATTRPRPSTIPQAPEASQYRHILTHLCFPHSSSPGRWANGQNISTTRQKLSPLFLIN